LTFNDALAFFFNGRLRELKAKYDPTNLFRINHNIEPLLK
jgi:hypothetical protein